MGARVFCGWQDVVEGRPKLMLSMIAAVMAVAMKKNKMTKQDVLDLVARGKLALEKTYSTRSLKLSRRGSSVTSIISAAASAMSPRGRTDAPLDPDRLVQALREDIRSELDDNPAGSDKRRVFLPSLPRFLGGGRRGSVAENKTVFKLQLGGKGGGHAPETHAPEMLNVTAIGFDPSALPRAPRVAAPPGRPPPATARGGAPHLPSPRAAALDRAEADMRI